MKKKNSLERDLEERINAEVESLKLQIKLLESELEISRMRAENSEEELRILKATIRLSAKMDSMDAITINESMPPPPPPPPMPNLLNSNNIFRSRSNSQTLNTAINDAQLKLQQTSELKNAKKATGRRITSHILHKHFSLIIKYVGEVLWKTFFCFMQMILNSNRCNTLESQSIVDITIY